LQASLFHDVFQLNLKPAIALLSVLKIFRSTEPHSQQYIVSALSVRVFKNAHVLDRTKTMSGEQVLLATKIDFDIISNENIT